MHHRPHRLVKNLDLYAKMVGVNAVKFAIEQIHQTVGGNQQ